MGGKVLPEYAQRQEMGELDKLLHHGLLMKGAVARLTSITKISGEVKTDYSGVQIEYLDPLGVKRSFLEEWPANYGNVKVGDAVDLFYVESNKKRKAASKYQLRGQSL